ncbi:MAG: GAF domain-containing protein [Acidobacteriota bacterium]
MKESEGGGIQRLTVPPGGIGELVSEMQTTLWRVRELVRSLEENLRGGTSHAESLSPAARVTELEARLAEAENDAKELAARLVESERQSGALMTLFVATYQLHASMDPEEVKAAIAEIALNMLGAEEFVLLLRKEVGPEYEIALKHGHDPGSTPMFAGDVYASGDPELDATLGDGLLRFGPTAESPALAIVPLRVQAQTVGAIVILRLLPHKPALHAEDRELLDLLSAHAAAALYAARIFEFKEQRLRTFEELTRLAEGLIKMARGESA